MFSKEKKDLKSFHKTISIDACPLKIWDALTIPELMKKWMSEEEIDIKTDWTVGSQVIIEGNQHWVYFKNKGLVLEFEKEKILRYTHLSSLSKLPDKPESYSTLEFRLARNGNKTELTFTVNNFPTEVIYKHLVFYWDITLGILKKFNEKNQKQS